MTLKELLTQVGFDELLPYLEKHEPEHLDNLYDFREAYDILRNMKPANNFEGKIFVEWHGGEWEDEEKWIREETWQRKFGPKVLTNKYEVALDKLEESIWRHQTPRRFRCRGENGERYTTLQSTRYLFNDRKNRSKRKREYRQDKREEYLKQMAARENLITKLSAEGSSFKRSDVDFLLHIEYGRQYDYLSVTSGTDGRLDYILESMTKYQQLALEKYNNAVVFIKVPNCCPLTEQELNKFKKAICLYLGYDDILFGTSDYESNKHDVKAMLMLSQR